MLRSDRATSLLAAGALALASCGPPAPVDPAAAPQARGGQAETRSAPPLPGRRYSSNPLGAAGPLPQQPVRDIRLGPGYETQGRWRRFRTRRFDPGLDAEQRSEIERLESIGYLAGHDPAPARSDVTAFERDGAQPGWNLYTSGHGPEAVLVDMEGRERHRWRYAFRDVWPDYPAPADHLGAQFWRRAHAFPNGDLLAIFEGLGIIKIDRDSRLLWGNPLRAHHDLQVLPNGEIYVLSREARIVPDIDPKRPVLEDFVSVLGPDGRERRRVSLLRAVASSGHEALWRATQKRRGDLYHANTLVVLDGRARHEAFRAGRVLTYLLGLGAIAVLDLEAEKLVWARWNEKEKLRHDPQILGNGNLLIFDNVAAKQRSSIIEYESLGPRVAWRYDGGEAAPFYSFSCGTVQRLENGNTLVTETDRGRAFEVTRDGRLVWEFYNPHRAGEDGRLIASLMELERLPSGWGAEWLAE